MTIFILLFFLLLLAYSRLIRYYRRSWNAIPEPLLKTDLTVTVSVVVAVRNEEKSIGKLLEYLVRQHYPTHLYDIIIADDHSEDATKLVVEQFPAGSLTITLVELEPGAFSKKAAITAAVKRSTGELIVATDADCEMGPDWIQSIVSCYRSSGAKFIAAPVKMTGGSSLLGTLQSLDFLTLQGITGASVFRQFHTMCNGANLAYTRSAFDEAGGFGGIDSIPSGDDMLLMHKIYKLHPDKVTYLKSREAIVSTPAERTWTDFFHQRIRWASKALYYKEKKIFYILMLVYLVNVAYLVLAVASVVQVKWLPFLLLFLVAKMIIEFPFVNAVSLFFGQTRPAVYFPFLQPVHIIYTIIAGWLGTFGSYKWKSRIIHNK